MQFDIHQEWQRLRWRARRGLLENDLLLERFFQRYEHDLNSEEIIALDALLDLPDNDLLDILLLRKKIETQQDTQGMTTLLAKFRSILNF